MVLMSALVLKYVYEPADKSAIYLSLQATHNSQPLCGAENGILSDHENQGFLLADRNWRFVLAN